MVLLENNWYTVEKIDSAVYLGNNLFEQICKMKARKRPFHMSNQHKGGHTEKGDQSIGVNGLWKNKPKAEKHDLKILLIA